MLKFLSKYKKDFIIGPIFKLIEAIIEVFLPFIIAQIINNLSNINTSTIIKYTGIMLVLIIIGLACAVIAQYIAAKTSQGFGTELRNKLFSHVLKLSNKQIEKYGTSAIVNRITNDILNLEVAVAMFIRLVIRVPFIFIGSLIMVYVLDSTISKILFVSTVILAVCIYVIIKKASKYQQKANTKLDEIALKVKENLLNIRLVKSFGTEKLEEQKFQKSNNENYKLSQKANIFSNLLNPVSVVILDFTIALVLYIGGIKISNNYMPQGNLIAIINYISQMILAVIVLSNLITIYTKSFVSYKRIKEILQETPEKDDEEKNIKIKNTDIAIEFKNVNFEYDKNKTFLKNINLQIKKGEKIGIIGLTGSGKSTILQLINKSYKISQGELNILGTNINEYTNEQIKSIVKLIEQNPNFYNTTIEENIKMGKNVPKKDIQKALKYSESYEFVQNLKEKEKYYIKFFNSKDRKIGYNLTDGGDGTFGRRHSDETKEKMRQKALGRKVSEEAKKRMSETHKLNYSDEHRKAVAESNARRTKKVLMFDKDLNVIKEFNSLKEAAAETKIHSTTIRKSIRGNKISYDYVFRFKDAV